MLRSSDKTFDRVFGYYESISILGEFSERFDIRKEDITAATAKAFLSYSVFLENAIDIYSGLRSV